VRNNRTSEYSERRAIALVYIGGTRTTLQLKHKYRKNSKASVELTHGCLLIMRDGTQANWVYQIPKTMKPLEQRLNLTFPAVIAPRV
jgi:alkylated DNA repair dioxygenase AlkB